MNAISDEEVYKSCVPDEAPYNNIQESIFSQAMQSAPKVSITSFAPCLMHDVFSHKPDFDLTVSQSLLISILQCPDAILVGLVVLLLTPFDIGQPMTKGTM